MNALFPMMHLATQVVFWSWLDRTRDPNPFANSITNPLGWWLTPRTSARAL